MRYPVNRNNIYARGVISYLLFLGRGIFVFLIRCDILIISDDRWHVYRGEICYIIIKVLVRDVSLVDSLFFFLSKWKKKSDGCRYNEIRNVTHSMLLKWWFLKWRSSSPQEKEERGLQRIYDPAIALKKECTLQQTRISYQRSSALKRQTTQVWDTCATTDRCCYHTDNTCGKSGDSTS